MLRLQFSASCLYILLACISRSRSMPDPLLVPECLYLLIKSTCTAAAIL